MNGSMEFDQQNLSPTYRFRPNVPGSSYALELAQRMGIPESIRNNARTNLGEQASKMENLLLDLDRQVQQLREDSTKATIERSKLNSLIAEYEEKLKGIRQEASKIKKKSQEEATQLINDAKSLIERSIKEIKESQAERKVVKEVKEKFLQEAEKLTSLDDSSDIPREISFDIGDRVRILDGTSVGEVIEIRGNSAVVLIGNSKITVRISNLRKAEGKRTEIRKAENVNFVHEARNEIDLRGMMGDEAVSAAERFLDDAYMSGFHKVYLIHGKGTGALRKRINEFLKTYPRLRSCHLGEWNEGGDGVTVVELSTE
jgi:DNA mismatch repair protein MutS2